VHKLKREQALHFVNKKKQKNYVKPGRAGGNAIGPE
jgi:hypothetical protein